MYKVIYKLCMLVLAGMFFIHSAMAAPPDVANVTITATSNQSNGGLSPDPDSGIATTETYLFERSPGSSVDDTITVTLCLTSSETVPPWNSITIDFNDPAPADQIPGVSMTPANITFSSSDTVGTCKDFTITINTDALITGNYVMNFNNLHVVSTDPAKDIPKDDIYAPVVDLAGIKNLHLVVAVLEVGTNVSCFMTDSSGSFLTDCDGTPVSASESDDGRFSIVTNKKKIEVATNPGQFYYNLVWVNTGSGTATVDIGFVRTGVNPHGTQAIHAAVFPGEFNFDQDAFDAANTDGIPEGADDAVSGVEVPSGATLLVTYHLVWEDIGIDVRTVVPPCANICEEANQEISVTGTITGDGIDETCTAGAWGYKKF